MNPSVVAAHKRIGLLQKFNKWQGKAMRRCKSPWTRWSRSLLTTQGGSLPKSLTEPLLSSQGKERQHAEKEEEFQDAPAPTRSSPNRGNSIELRVELTWRSPCLRTLGSSTINPVPGLLSDLDPYNLRASTTPPRPRKPHHFKMKKREEEPQARSSEPKRQPS
ncbi:unnamed protein product [Microthlaspi erraticum]|uniref:Uncharacterized protein n=1 Tax=Microthlaspi erraticum TaxID=1685480 RepID=A0A6D2JW11_9BRAS|nr:unnamed protein product [Microthlaspi erraticum]